MLSIIKEVYIRKKCYIWGNKSKLPNKKAKDEKSVFPKLSLIFMCPVWRLLTEVNLRQSSLWTLRFLVHYHLSPPISPSLPTHSLALRGLPPSQLCSAFQAVELEYRRGSLVTDIISGFFSSTDPSEKYKLCALTCLSHGCHKQTILPGVMFSVYYTKTWV